MPELTNEDVNCGFVGLSVVFARRNEMTPAAENPMLTNATASANNRRMPVGTWSEGVSRESSHMAAATSTAIAGGGTLSSSDFIGSIMRPNVVVNGGSILPVRSA